MPRKTLLAGSALALFSGAALAAEPVVYVPPAAPPAPAAPFGPVAMGSVGASYGIWSLDADGTEIEGTVLEFVGDANIPFGAWNFELEGGGSKIGIDDLGIDVTINTWAAGTHIYYRNPTFAAGVFAEYQSIGALFDITNYSLGVEAAYFWGSFLIGLEGAWANYDIAGLADFDSWYAGGNVAYFFTPNAKLEANVRYTLLDLSGLVGDDANLWSFGLTGEYKFGSSPLALFVSGRYDIIDVDDIVGADVDVSAWSVSGGIKVYLGGNNATLWDHATIGEETFDFSDVALLPFAQ